MRKAGFLFLIAIGTALPVIGGSEESVIQGYGYFGVMGSDGTTIGKLLQPGLGTDIFVFKGLAANIDASYIAYYNDFSADGFGLASANGAYHLFRSSKISPFVTGGYSIAFRSGTSNMGNYGGGLNYWFSPRVALRIEARDYRDSGGHIGGLRVGITFR